MMAIRAGEEAGGVTLSVADESETPGAAWFRALSAADLDRAYRLAGFVLGDASEAEDVAQDALAKAWDRRATLHSVTSGRAWFDRIVVNLCRDRLRRRRTGVRWLQLDEDTQAVRDPFARAIEGDETLRGLASLDADHRIVVVLRFWADLPLDQIADRLGVPLGTVKSRLHYALRDLRAAIEATRSAP